MENQRRGYPPPNVYENKSSRREEEPVTEGGKKNLQVKQEKNKKSAADMRHKTIY